MRQFNVLVLAMILAVSAISTAFASTVIHQQIEVTATSTSTEAIVYDSSRKYLLVVNKGANTAILKFGSAHSGTEGVPVPSGGNYEPKEVPVDAMYVVAPTGSPTLSIVTGR